MFKPTPGQIRTFLSIVRYGTELPKSYQEMKDGLYKYILEFYGSIEKEDQLSLDECKVLLHMPVIEMFALLNK